MVSGISQHSVPLVWPEVKPDVRPGERRAMSRGPVTRETAAGVMDR